MTTIIVETSNCDQERHYLIEEMADSAVTLEMQFDEIVSVQSRTARKQKLFNAIRAEFTKFKWLIAGSIRIEFAWYLHGVERQETDKVGDIDNITKPILDALAGPNGIIIDDSQIGSVHTFWMSRNEQVAFNVLRLKIEFSNDDCLDKESLIFVKYWNAMCVALNLNFSDLRSVFGACVVVQMRKRHRRIAGRLREMGTAADSYLVRSRWDFHRTRIGMFAAESILTTAQLRQRAFDAGLTRIGLRKFR